MPDSTPPPPRFPRLPCAFGDYEIYARLGEGGMGEVYQAVERKTGKDVALKFILLDPAESAAEGGQRALGMRQRFILEAETLSRLKHENIVLLHQLTEHEGTIFIVMELVAGGTLAERLADPIPLGLEEAVKLVVCVARAVHAAHAKGIIHRDLKPANVLLDQDGKPMLTDFGLARFTRGGSGFVRSSGRSGTPRYQAPELRQSDDPEPTIATDIYSLGILLQDCLQGQSAAPLPRDLTVIADRATAHDPADRFSSAAAFADDLERFLRHEPIQSRDYTAGERLRMWCRRRPQAALASAGTLVVGLAALITILVLWRSAETANRSLAKSVVRDALSLAQADYAAGNTSEALLKISAAQQQIPGDPQLADWLANRLSRNPFLPVWRSLPHPEEVAFAKFDRPRGRLITAGVGGAWLHEVTSGRQLLHLPTTYVGEDPYENQTKAAWVSADGRVALVEEVGYRLAVWEIQNPATPSLLWSNQACALLAVAPDCSAFLFAETNGTVWHQALGGGPAAAPLKLPGLPNAPVSLALSSQGVGYASLTNGQVLTWTAPAAKWNAFSTWKPGESQLLLSSNGAVLLAAVGGREFAAWNTTDASLRFTYQNRVGLSANTFQGFDLSWDGALLALTANDRFLYLLDTQEGTQQGDRIALGANPATVRFTPSGRFLTATTDRGQCRVVQVSPPRVVAVASHDRTIIEADYDEQSGWTAGGTEGQALLWHLSTAPPPTEVATNLPGINDLVLIPSQNPSTGIRPAPPEFLALVGSQTLQRIQPEVDHFAIQTLATCSNAACLALAAGPPATAFIGDTNGGLHRLTLAATPVLGELHRFKAPIHRLAASPDGQRLMVVAGSNLAFLGLDGDHPRELTNYALPSGITTLAISPNGEFSAAGVYAGTLTVFNLRTGGLLWQTDEDLGPRYGLMFSPDSRLLAGTSMSGPVRVWESVAHRETMPCFNNLAELSYPVSVAWDGAGTRLLASGQESAVLLDARTGARLSHFAPLTGLNRGLLSADAQRAVFYTQGSAVKLWSTTPAFHLATWNTDKKDYNRAIWAGDEERVLVHGPGGELRLIRLRGPSVQPELLRTLVEWLTARTVNAAGVVLILDEPARAERLARLRAAAARGDLAPAYARHLPPL